MVAEIVLWRRGSTIRVVFAAMVCNESTMGDEHTITFVCLLFCNYQSLLDHGGKIDPYLGGAARLHACSHGGSHTLLSLPDRKDADKLSPGDENYDPTLYLAQLLGILTATIGAAREVDY
ncbi:hypothetical protein Tco_1371207 [Tanacetum coccineum]